LTSRKVNDMFAPNDSRKVETGRRSGKSPAER
jgi:hypothetical protein